MIQSLHERLHWLESSQHLELLAQIGRGIEKESLRITSAGKLATTPHPPGLGSALAHTSITTDFSESLLELITPVHRDVDAALAELEDVHKFVYQHLEQEILWAASMPCVVHGDDSIPIARYGSSNVARMKEVYRDGLGNRYGRTMQAIAGVHYNFSMPEAFWHAAAEAEGLDSPDKFYISDRYLGLIRNFRRYSWLLIYLFGASPAVCSSFLKGRDDHQLIPFDDQGYSLHLPWATSLRMGDLGYQSNAQRGLSICYNSLDNYIETLRGAIQTPHEGYAGYSAGEGGHYTQLTHGLLQIENEFYSAIRPKRVTQSGEIPLGALSRRGVEYIEVRCLDVNPFTPLGLDAEQIRFVDAFLLFCLMADSPLCDEVEQSILAENQHNIVNRGREPGLTLRTREGEQPMTELANDLLTAIGAVTPLLDRAHGGERYQAALATQRACVQDAELTPSARILREMKEEDVPFFRLAMNYSEKWARQLARQPLNENTKNDLEQETKRSISLQKDIETADDISFEQYLKRFYEQYEQL